MKTDILIVVEKRKREIENSCLLSAELQRRGFSVKILNVLSLQRYFTKSKVVIAPHLYNEFQVNAIAKNIYLKSNAIIDLQYEQVLSTENIDDIHNPCESATLAEHTAWGKSQVDKYIACGINKDKVHTVGHVAMDLMNSRFDKYFFSKEILQNRYKLNPKKRWALYLSSFSYTDLTDKELVSYEKLNPKARSFAKISEESKESIHEWLSRACIEFPETEFIYRKHPAEHLSVCFKMLESKCSNFHCIDDFSVRQWVKSCDLLYTWYSTSIVDAYFAGKQCKILRPIDIPSNLEVDIMRDGYFLTNYDDFKASLNTLSNKFSINKERIEYYYGGLNPQRLAYEKISDICERIISSPNNFHQYKYTKPFDILNTCNLRKALIDWFWRIIFDINRYVKLSNVIDPLRKILSKEFKTFTMIEAEAYGMDKEINEYIRRFNNVLANSK